MNLGTDVSADDGTETDELNVSLSAGWSLLAVPVDLPDTPKNQAWLREFKPFNATVNGCICS